VKDTGNLDTREGKESLPIIKSMIPWSEKIYDMTDEQIAEYKSAFKDEYHNSPEQHTREVIDVFYIEYQYFQVRKTYQWVMEQYALSGDKMAIRREILLQRLRGSDKSPIDPEDLEYLIANMAKSTDDIIINNKWLFKLYEHGQGLTNGIKKAFDEKIPYIVGIDPSAGGGGDNFAIEIVNPYNLKIAAEFKSPYLTAIQACKLLISLVENYIPRAVLIPEKNSMGIYLIQMICETSIKGNLYWSEKGQELEEMVSENANDAELQKLSVQYKKYGTYLTKKIRDAMFELLFTHVRECKDILNTEYLVEDICKLQKSSTGKIAALDGEHDDSLMAYLHAIYLYYTGDNLPRFGIIKNDHPIFGKIEEDTDDKIENQSGLSQMFSVEQCSFDEFVMQDAARVENEIKDMVSSLSFVNNDVYNKDNSNNINEYDDTASLPAHFFDVINDLDYTY
jgi:hypothetical protein